MSYFTLGTVEDELGVAVLCSAWGCRRLTGPEDTVRAYMQAAYDGDGYALQERMLLIAVDREEQGTFRLVDVDEWVELMKGRIRKKMTDPETSPKERLEAEEELKNFEQFRENFDADVAVASVDLTEKGELKEIETALIERNGDWACVDAKYRFEDGSTYVPDQYEDDKGAKAARFAPDGYYFLHRQEGKWYVLDDVPDSEARRYSVTAASTFLNKVTAGIFDDASTYLSGSASGAGGEVDEVFADLQARQNDGKYALTGRSLVFVSRKETSRTTVVSYEVRVTDVDSTVHTETANILLRLNREQWEVDRNAVKSEISKLASLAQTLAEIKAEAERRQAREKLEEQRRPVVLLDQAQSISFSTQLLAHTFTPSRAGRLKLDVRVLNGSAVGVDLMPPEEYQKLRRNRFSEYRRYDAFVGKGVLRQSFEMPVQANVAYVLYVRPEEYLSTSRLELTYWFEPY